jgi:hypothetical protein
VGVLERGWGLVNMPVATKCKKCGFLAIEKNKEFAFNELYFHFIESHGYEPTNEDMKMWIITNEEYENARIVLALTRNKVLYSFKLCLKK